MQENKFDIIIIGAGIIGCMIARFLSQYDLKILLIEKEYDIGTGQSSGNSAIIHSGHDPISGTLKAKLNVSGNKMWENIAKDLSIPFKRTGSYVVAIGEEEFVTVQKLYERAILNGVPSLRILKKSEILYREPKINPEVTGALWTPTTGVIDTFEAVIGVCENAITNGVKLMLNTSFKEFIFENNKIIGIKTNNGDFYSNWVINCAGLNSDDVMKLAGIRKDFNMIPTKGEYLIFDAAKVELNTVLYPVPTNKGKGTLVTTTTHGNVMIGPNSEVVDNKNNKDTSYDGYKMIIENAKKLVPSLDIKNIIASFAGLRAKGNHAGNDFIIEKSDNYHGLINLGAIDSPGLASAPAIAQMVIDLLKSQGEKLTEKPNYNPIRKPHPCFHKLSHAERAELVKTNPSFGRIICRCEEITEAEIVAAIHSPIPAKTYDAIKRRTWLGTGRCQGAFDYPRVIEILARELGVSTLDITKKEKGSEFLFRKTKE